VPLLIPAVVMAVYGIWGLARDSAMGNDEVATKWAALLSLRHLAHLLRHVDAVHGLYYLLMHCWVVLGSSPTVLRIPSVLAMIAAAFLVALLARRLTGSAWAGVFAGLAMALTPVVSYYAQTARSYALVYACVAGATLVLVRALAAEAAGDRQVAVRWWVGYAALVLVGGYLNEMALLALVAHGVTVLLARHGRKVFAHWLIAAVIGAVLVLPLVALSVKQHGAVAWIPRPGAGAVRVLFRDYFGVTTAVAVLLVICALIALLPERRGRAAADGPAGTGAAADGAASPWWRSGGVTLPSVGLPLLVLPALLLIVESLVASPLYVDRYVLYGEAGAALLAGGGAYRIGQWLAGAARRRELIAVPGVIVCALALVLQLGPQHRVREPGSRQYNFGTPSQYVAAHARHGDGVMFFGTLFRKARLGYPRDYRQLTDFAMAQSPVKAGNFRGTDKPFSVVGPLMQHYQRIWVLGARPSPSLAGGFGPESTELQQDFSLVTVRHYRGIVVTLWQRR
jgi:mannosyltransferase